VSSAGAAQREDVVRQKALSKIRHLLAIGVEEQKALLESEQMAQAIIESSLDAFVQLDENGAILRWSSRAEAMLGWTREEAVGQNLRDLIIPEENRPANLQRLTEFLQEFEKGLPGRRYESPSLRRDGTQFMTEVSLTALRRPEGYIINGFLRDITEKLAAEEQLRQAQKTKSDFLAMMSHEIRTPMTGMMGMIDLLSATNLNQEQQELVKIAQGSAHSLLKVVNSVLDFSKFGEGKVALETIDFNVKDSLNSVIALLGPRAREQGLRLETSLSDDVPEWLKGDPSRLGQILLNLVGNAIKFTEQGTVRIEASLRALVNDVVELRFDVIDSGTGIPAEVQASLFNPFIQADTSVSRRYGGTGLGLAICRQLCTAMGGIISVESEPGQGSRFWFTIQCGIGKTPEVAAPPLAPPTEIEAETLDILVAEDNEIVRSLISKLLARRGYHADLVCNGRQAVEAVQSKSYHLVLMDMQMPDMDGITATETIRALSGPEREVPIIALTANALAGRDICLAAGMNSFLTKPIQPDALYAAILKWRITKTTGSNPSADANHVRC
jgi:PAS domain S-box-containing protein